MKIAIAIGHTLSSQGAKNASKNISEFEYSEIIASDLAQKLTIAGVEHEIIYRESYSQLPEKINKLNPTHIISLHCNAFNTEATGTETLYYHSSEASKNMADLFQQNTCRALGLTDRGIKPKHSEDRGGHLLKETIAPCIILEPYFIDNDSDFVIAQEKHDLLVDAYLLSILQL